MPFVCDTDSVEFTKPASVAVVESVYKFSEKYESFAWFAVANFFSSGITTMLVCGYGLYSLANRVQEIQKKNPEASFLSAAQEAFAQSASGVEKFALWMFARMSGFGMVSNGLSLAGSLAASARAARYYDAVAGVYSAVMERFGSTKAFTSQMLEPAAKGFTTMFLDSIPKGKRVSGDEPVLPRSDVSVQPTKTSVDTSDRRSDAYVNPFDVAGFEQSGAFDSFV